SRQFYQGKRIAVGGLYKMPGDMHRNGLSGLFLQKFDGRRFWQSGQRKSLHRRVIQQPLCRLPGGEQKQDRLSAQSSECEQQSPERRVVEPLHIVDEEDHWLLLRRGCEQPHGGHIGGEWVGSVSDGFYGNGRSKRFRLDLRDLIEPSQDGTQQLCERRERQFVLRLDSPGRQYLAVWGSLQRFFDERSLPDSRLTFYQKCRPLPASQVLDELLQAA